MGGVPLREGGVGLGRRHAPRASPRCGLSLPAAVAIARPEASLAHYRVHDRYRRSRKGAAVAPRLALPQALGWGSAGEYSRWQALGRHREHSCMGRMAGLGVRARVMCTRMPLERSEISRCGAHREPQDALPLGWRRAGVGQASAMGRHSDLNAVSSTCDACISKNG